MSDTITLPSQDVDTTAGTQNLAQLAQQHAFLILYFYPKDSTAGCTKQANQFSELKQELDQLNACIVGISRDSIKSHQNFIEKQAINFDLISDKDEVLCKHFDVIKEKNMYGKKVFGIERSTFVFKGEKLIKAYRKVKADGHAQIVLDDLKALL
ncbi:MULTISPECIES: peroxiredoxin [unclassified Acinetobacter]|uniref:peroxiredoxin n=1 Tax=unclassified Acinetobacter TaxID=196816 RepID=UPI0035B715EE